MVLRLHGFRIPREYGIIFETHHNGAARRQKEHLLIDTNQFTCTVYRTPEISEICLNRNTS